MLNDFTLITLQSRSCRVSHKAEVTSEPESKKIYCGLRSVNAKRYNRDYFIHGDDDRLAGPDLSFSPEQTVQSDDMVRTIILHRISQHQSLDIILIDLFTRQWFKTPHDVYSSVII